MQFRELVLHNVGVYHGRQTVDLRSNSGRPIVLVGGLNGCGKTTFLDALKMVLYGRRARLSGRSVRSWDRHLSQLISRDVDPTDGASIQLTFNIDLDGASHEYCVLRSWNSTKSNVKEQITVKIDGTYDAVISSEWDDHIEDLLPLEIASLFFFDGEQIEALADQQTASTVIRSAIHSLLGIGTIERLSTDLVALQRRQAPIVDDPELRSRIELYLGQREELGHAFDERSQNLADRTNQLIQQERRCDEAEQHFANEGGSLYERSNELSAVRSTTAATLKELREQLVMHASGAQPLALVQSQLSKIVMIGNESEDAVFASRFSDLLVTRDKWILSQLGDAGNESFRLALETDRERRLTASNAKISAVASPADAKVANSALESIKVGVVESTILLKKCADCEYQLEKLDSMLAGVPTSDQIAEAMRNRDQARLNLARIEGEIQVLKEEVERIQRDMDGCANRIDSAEADRREQLLGDDYTARVLRHTDRARETLQILQQQLVARHISKIEVAILDSLRLLLRKQSLITDIRVDPTDFSVHLSNEAGHELPSNSLSAGERQLLAVSILWGLAKVAGNKVPTIIDTPLGRLDSEHRANLVERYFPNAGAQVLLLSTDQEIDAKLYEILKPRVAQSYLLTHDEQSGHTSVDVGYWWDPKSGAKYDVA